MNYTFTSVYGPVKSWRFGQSLGIDPIGSVSTCSFNCVYCQLGEIEYQSCDRQVFVPTRQIQTDLQSFAPWDVDIITLSGSGEPTLAQNLGEILLMVKAVTAKPVGVLTNGSLLKDPVVQEELAIANRVAVKTDAISSDLFRRINRPVAAIDLLETWDGLWQFRQRYQGILAIQTMLLSPWDERSVDDYIALLRNLAPDEIQLNTPTRPKPLNHQLDARGNQNSASQPYPVRSLKPVSAEFLRTLSDRIFAAIGIPVRYPLTVSH